MRLLFGMMQMGRVFYDANNGGGSGGGGGSGETPEQEIARLKSELTSRDNKIKELSAGKGGGGDDPDLAEKTRLERERREKENGSQKEIAEAVTFTVKSAEFLKKHESILPSDAGEIFAQADKETYDSPVQKAAAIKSALIQNFFKIQANIDELTPSQKTQLEDYLKLSKTGKEEKAAHVFVNIFEPALELSKRLKKADELERARKGFGNSSDDAKAYKEKMMNLSQKHYFKRK